MVPRIFCFIAALLLLTTRCFGGTDGWAQLKLGMTTDETTELLGAPLIESIARGFELWIYDNSAEALFYGGILVGWTTPSKPTVATHTVDVWQRKPESPYAPVFLLPRPTPRIDRQRENRSGDSIPVPLYKIRSYSLRGD